MQKKIISTNKIAILISQRDTQYLCHTLLFSKVISGSPSNCKQRNCVIKNHHLSNLMPQC